MNGTVELSTLLKTMHPELSEVDYVFCTVQSDIDSISQLEPISIFKEDEGLTLVLEKSTAEAQGFTFSGVFNKITLQVHSSLDAVGLTAAVAQALTDKGISANVIAGYYHDHIFVQTHKSALAVKALFSLSKEITSKGESL